MTSPDMSVGHRGDDGPVPTRFSARSALDWRPQNKASRRAVDVALVLGLPLVVLIVFGVNQWVHPYTPDSDFYYGLGHFGNDLIVRATDPGYYWTRIGLIGPVYALIHLFGDGWGYAIWRVVLLVITVLPLYLLVKPRLGRIAAGTGVLILATNTTILVTLMDFYPSSAVIAACSVLAGFGCLALEGRTPTHRTLCFAALAGAGSGWLMAIHIGSIAVNVGASFGLLIMMIVQYRKGAWRSVLSFGLGAALVFGVFLLWLRALFPGRNWFTANYEAITQTGWDFFHEKTLNWLWSDPNLLIIPAAVAIGIIASTRRSQVQGPTRTLTVMLVLAALLASIQQFRFGGQNLQLPYYYTQLWPFAIQLIAMAALGVATIGWQRRVLLVAAVLVLPLVGMSAWTFGWVPVGLVIAGLLVTFYAVAALVLQRDQRGLAAQVGAFTMLVAMLCGMQVLQNGLGALSGLVIARQSPNQAFAESKPWIKPYFGLAKQAEGWVVANTQGREMVTWTGGPNLELWGPAFIAVDNTVLTGLKLSPTDAQLTVIKRQRPATLAYTAPTVAAAQGFIKQIPQATARAELVECRSFQEEQLSVGTCLARLTFPGRSR